MRVVTNGQVRELSTWDDLSPEDKGRFDYIQDDEAFTTRFVKYRGSWYDVMDAQTITVAPRYEPFGYNVVEENPLAAWHHIISETFWSAVVFKWPSKEQVHRFDLYGQEYDYIIVGRCFE